MVRATIDINRSDQPETKSNWRGKNTGICQIFERKNCKCGRGDDVCDPTIDYQTPLPVTRRTLPNRTNWPFDSGAHQHQYTNTAIEQQGMGQGQQQRRYTPEAQRERRTMT